MPEDTHKESDSIAQSDNIGLYLQGIVLDTPQVNRNVLDCILKTYYIAYSMRNPVCLGEYLINLDGFEFSASKGKCNSR